MLWVRKPLQKFQACLYPQKAGYYLCPCLINLEALSTLAFLSLGFSTGGLEWMSPVFIAVDSRRTTGMRPLQIDLDRIQIRWGTGRLQWGHGDQGQRRHRGKVRASMGCMEILWAPVYWSAYPSLCELCGDWRECWKLGHASLFHTIIPSTRNRNER